MDRYPSLYEKLSQYLDHIQDAELDTFMGTILREIITPDMLGK